MSVHTSASSDQQDEFLYDGDNPVDQINLIDIADVAAFRRGLSLGALATFHFILVRTIRFGKLQEAITRRQFLDGMWKDGRCFQAGVRLSPRGLSNAINELKSAGLIKTKTTRKRAFGRIFDVVSYRVELDGLFGPEDVPTFRLPREMQMKVQK